MGKFLLTLLFFSLFLLNPTRITAEDNMQDILESLADLEAEEEAAYMQETEKTAEFQIFRTLYTTIYYTHEEDLESLLWRITGNEDIDIYLYPSVAKSHVDRIVEKVQAILDMYPERFHVKVYVHRRHDKGPFAFYSYRTRSITTYADRITDRVFAHEVVHAIIHAYFKILPPKKIREMLSQYADQHLWKE